jgi:cytochrome bd ubiquinol oxidase subunit II
MPGLTIRAAAAGRAALIATIVGVAAGAAMLVPSLALLYSLVLRGRLDTAVVAMGAGVAEPGERAAARRVVLSRLSVAFALASLAIGAGLLVFADSARAHGIGAVALLACAVLVSAMAVAPGEEN